MKLQIYDRWQINTIQYNKIREDFRKQSVVILLKYGCSVRHMSSVQYLFLDLWPKILKNTFEIVHT